MPLLKQTIESLRTSCRTLDMLLVFLSQIVDPFDVGMRVLFNMLLLFMKSAVCKFIVKRFQLAGLNPVALILQERGHLDFFFGLFQFAAVVSCHFFIKKLL